MGFFKKMDAFVSGYPLKCPAQGCGSSLDGAEYKFRELRRSTGSGSDKVTVRFDYRCPQCGKAHYFSHEFTLSRGENLQTKVELFAEKVFGH